MSCVSFKAPARPSRVFSPALLLELDPTRLARAGDSLDALWNELVALGYRPCEPNEAQTPLAAPSGGDVLWLPGR